MHMHRLSVSARYSRTVFSLNFSVYSMWSEFRIRYIEHAGNGAEFQKDEKYLDYGEDFFQSKRMLHPTTSRLAWICYKPEL